MIEKTTVGSQVRAELSDDLELRHLDGSLLSAEQLAAREAARSERNPYGVVFAPSAENRLGVLVGNLLLTRELVQKR
jgi:hypothetical protein